VKRGKRKNWKESKIGGVHQKWTAGEEKDRIGLMIILVKLEKAGWEGNSRKLLKLSPSLGWKFLPTG